MKCVICDTAMKQNLDWAWQCPCCDFWHSTLEPAAGRGIDGLEDLRRENFKILCDQLERLTPLKDKACLEVGCAEGWFLDEATSRNTKCVGIEPSDVSKIAMAAGHEVKVGFF